MSTWPSGSNASFERHTQRPDAIIASGFRLFRRARLLAHLGQNDIGGACARRLVAGGHDGVEFCERLDLLPPRLGRLDDFAHRRRQLRGSAVLLQKFRDHVFADDEVGEDHGIHLDRPQQDEGFDRAGAIGRHHRHASQAPAPASPCRIWPAPHARCGMRPASPARRSRCAAAPSRPSPPPSRHPADAASSAAPPQRRHPPPAGGTASRRKSSCGGGFRCGGFPATPAAPAAPPRAASARRRWGGAGRSARSGDGRHSCRAAPAACS